MSEKEKIKKLLQIYEWIIIHNGIRKDKMKIENYLKGKTPVVPYLEISYPEYDEDIYLRKAKEEEKGKYSEFRTSVVALGLYMMGSIIGLVICWIPFLLALFSFPVQVGMRRRAAYKIYLRECEEIKNRYGLTRERNEINCEKNKIMQMNYDKSAEYFKNQEKWLESLFSDLDSKRKLLESEKIRLFKNIGFSSIYFENYDFLITVDKLLDKNPNYSITQLTELYKSTDANLIKKMRSDFFNNCAIIEDKICSDLYKHIDEQVRSYPDMFASNYPCTLLESFYDSI